MSSKNTRSDCLFCITDARTTDYRRRKMWFCRRKCTFFSRNYRPGEGGRILPEQAACPDFEAAETDIEDQTSKETVLDESEM